MPERSIPVKQHCYETVHNFLSQIEPGLLSNELIFVEMSDCLRSRFYCKYSIVAKTQPFAHFTTAGRKTDTIFEFF